jgi:hypothetical protein
MRLIARRFLGIGGVENGDTFAGMTEPSEIDIDFDAGNAGMRRPSRAE